MLTFAYYRVSTLEQTVENQALELKRAGYEPQQVYAETVSGSVSASERPEFGKLLEAVERTVTRKRLVVSKIDRLGRDAGDVLATVERLGKAGCSVKVVQLGDTDLTGPAGKLLITMLAAVAELERNILIERTQAGMQRARAAGVQMGRPAVLDADDVQVIRTALDSDHATKAALAREYGVSRATIQRVGNGTYKGAEA